MMGEWTSGRHRLLLALGILVSFVGCDQVTKQIATETLQNEPSVSLLNNTVRLEYALNPGGFLSLGASLPSSVRTGFFIGMNVLLLGGVAVFLIRSSRLHPVAFLSLTCILAGGIGNLIDRVANQGLVIDFINLGVGSLRTGVFNVADIGVTCGAVTLMLFSHRMSRMSSADQPGRDEPV